jgi:RimJ/RimL family protein N-acetyltransferase
MIDPALIRHALPARLATARLELRRDEVADAPAVLAAVQASRRELAPWLDWVIPGYDLAEAVRGQRRSIEYWDAGDSFQWRLWRGGTADSDDSDLTTGSDGSRSPDSPTGSRRSDSPTGSRRADARGRDVGARRGRRPAQLVGSIDLHTVDWAARTAELGYWLDSRETGQGYLAEAGPEIVELAFSRLGFARLTCRCHPDNARSIAAARRLGFHARAVDLDGTVCLSRAAP